MRQGERNVVVVPGTRIAGLPRNMLKLAVDWRAGEAWSFGADLQAFSSRTVARNEDGLLEDRDPAEGPIARSLKIAGYTILNLRASWKPSPQWELYASLNNALDKQYESLGALAKTVFTRTGSYAGEAIDALFVAPGAPRALFVGAALQVLTPSCIGPFAGAPTGPSWGFASGLQRIDQKFTRLWKGAIELSQTESKDLHRQARARTGRADAARRGVIDMHVEGAMTIVTATNRQV